VCEPLINFWKDTSTRNGDLHDLVMAELKPPNSWIGKKLSDLNVPSKYGVLVVGVKSSEDFILGNRDYVVKDSDILLITGKTQDVYNFLRQQR